MAPSGRARACPAAARMVGVAAVRVSFAEAAKLIDDLVHLHVATKRVEQAAEALGRARLPRGRSPEHPPPRRFTPAWTAPACQCGRAKSRAVRASNPTGGRRPVTSSWSQSGLPRAAIARASGPSLGVLLCGDRERRQSRFRSAPRCLRPTHVARGRAARVPNRHPPRRDR